MSGPNAEYERVLLRPRRWSRQWVHGYVQAVLPDKWAEGLAEALEILKPMMLSSYQTTDEARRRVWKARDEADRLRRLLAEAEVTLIAAERDYEDAGKHMGLVWEDLKEGVKKIPIVADTAPSDGGGS